MVSSALRADVVRVLPNGDVVVGGRAEPGSRVALLDNGETLMEMQVDPATGEFVFLPPRLQAGAHTLSLRGAPPADGGPAAERELMAFSIAPNVKAAPPLPQPAAAPSPPLVLKSDMRTIARGDTLWRISREWLGRGALYTTIVQANSDKIRNPHLIYPGQSLTLPRSP